MNCDNCNLSMTGEDILELKEAGCGNLQKKLTEYEQIKFRHRIEKESIVLSRMITVVISKENLIVVL